MAREGCGMSYRALIQEKSSNGSKTLQICSGFPDDLCLTMK